MQHTKVRAAITAHEIALLQCVAGIHGNVRRPPVAGWASSPIHPPAAWLPGPCRTSAAFASGRSPVGPPLSPRVRARLALSGEGAKRTTPAAFKDQGG